MMYVHLRILPLSNISSTFSSYNVSPLIFVVHTSNCHEGSSSSKDVSLHLKTHFYEVIVVSGRESSGRGGLEVILHAVCRQQC